MRPTSPRSSVAASVTGPPASLRGLEGSARENPSRSLDYCRWENGVVRPARLELATFGFVVRRSIQLSYGRTSRTPDACGSGSLPQESGVVSGAGAVGAPVGLSRLGQGVDRVVVLVAPGQ